LVQERRKKISIVLRPSITVQRMERFLQGLFYLIMDLKKLSMKSGGRINSGNLRTVRMVLD
jgi:hypothetical protein